MATTNKVHISLNVADIDASVGFYQKMFGLEPVKHFADYAKFDVGNPGLNLTLNKLPGGRSPERGGGVSHLGVQVASTEDVLAYREKWESSGLLPRDEMQVACCYAKQDKTWVSDPDGNEWEVFVVLEDISPEQKAETAEETGCCLPDAPVGIAEKEKAENVSGQLCC